VILSTRQWMAGPVLVSQYHGYAGLAMVMVPVDFLVLIAAPGRDPTRHG
jgi:hypothetical protein